jgi:hypothetical protein
MQQVAPWGARSFGRNGTKLLTTASWHPGFVCRFLSVLENKKFELFLFVLRYGVRRLHSIWGSCGRHFRLYGRAIPDCVLQI